MAKLAKDTIILGGHGEIQAGEEIPKTYRDSRGEQCDTDFDRLEELGLVADGDASKEGYDGFKKADLVDLVQERQLDVPADAKVEDLRAALEADDASKS